MKTIKPKNHKKKRSKTWLILLFCFGGASIVLISMFAVVYLLFFLIVYFGFQEKTYQVHHPAIYYIQDDFFQLGDNVYYMKDGRCLVFDDKKETKEIILEHISDDFYVSDNILYVYLDEHIYAYNSSFKEISVYDTGFIVGKIGKRFIVLGD